MRNNTIPVKSLKGLYMITQGSALGIERPQPKPEGAKEKNLLKLPAEELQMTIRTPLRNEIGTY
tara:strand:+ start:151 stop:342 length:192 start_codon:yes stop_codon:yes gene_type:complete